MRYQRRYSVATSWTIVLRKAPIGWLSRLEDGPYYRGPASWIGLTWWWRSSELGAYERALREAEEHPR